MPTSKILPKPLAKCATIRVVVNLTLKDHKSAMSAAKSSKEELGGWISSLVHTALQP